MKKVPLFCESQSAIRIHHNQVQHSMTKHIVFRYHFIKDHIEDDNIEVHFIQRTYQHAYIFTNPLDEKYFLRILNGLGMIEACYVPKSS